MKNLFKIGDQKYFEKTVDQSDIAAFESGAVHDVYSTFAIARDAEWCCRLFVLEMKENDEEGIGTFVTVNHLAPALVNSTILFSASITELRGNAINCSWEARENGRLVANGTQGQKIIKKQKLETLFESLKKNEQ